MIKRKHRLIEETHSLVLASLKPHLMKKKRLSTDHGGKYLVDHSTSSFNIIIGHSEIQRGTGASFEL